MYQLFIQEQTSTTPHKAYNPLGMETLQSILLNLQDLTHLEIQGTNPPWMTKAITQLTHV